MVFHQCVDTTGILCSITISSQESLILTSFQSLFQTKIAFKTPLKIFLAQSSNNLLSKLL
jgi:hypothetical protein